MVKEIITLQLGPFSNFVGSHFWNVQDDARHPVGYDEGGDPLYEDQQANAEHLYRSSGRGTQLTPRLVLCDAADNFGTLNQQGIALHDGAGPAVPDVDPLAWAGSVQQVVQEARDTHAFVKMMGAPLLNDHGQQLSAYADEYEEEEEEDDDDEDEDDYARRRSPKRGRTPARWGAPTPPPPNQAAGAGGAGPGQGGQGDEGDEGEEAVRSGAFDFENSVESWCALSK